MLMVIMNGRWKEEGKLWILILVTNMGKYRCWAAENYNQDAQVYGNIEWKLKGENMNNCAR